MAAVGDEQNTRSGCAPAEEGMDIIVEERALGGDVPRAQRLVAAIRFVAGGVRLPVP